MHILSGILKIIHSVKNLVEKKDRTRASLVGLEGGLCNSFSSFISSILKATLQSPVIVRHFATISRRFHNN